MNCNKCGHRMNKLEDKEDGVIIRIRHKCGNVDCRHTEVIERTVYQEIKAELSEALRMNPGIENNVNFLMERL